MEIYDFWNTSPILIWEFGKAILRGKIISYSSYKKTPTNQSPNWKKKNQRTMRLIPWSRYSVNCCIINEIKKSFKT